MDMKRLKKALLRSFLVVASVFSIAVVLIAGIYTISGEYIPPALLTRLSGVYAAIFLLTVVRLYLSESKWAYDKPYIVINIMFMPVYLTVSVAGLFLGNPMLNISDLPLMVGLFVATFTVVQTIVYFKKKSGTDRMNDALNEFLKEHRENEHEE